MIDKNSELVDVSEDLTKLIRGQALADPVYAEIDHLFNSDRTGPLNLDGPSDAQKTAVMLSLLDGKPACLLVSDELRARAAAAEIRAMSDQPVLIFRPREYNLTDADAASRDTEMKRLAILNSLLEVEDNSAAIVIVTATAAIQKTMSAKSFARWSYRLETGLRFSIEKLCSTLQTLGYERVQLVESAGQFARRGDIVDIALPSPEAQIDLVGVRVSFFDDEIDSIRELDTESQRSLSVIDKVNIFPVRDLIIDEEVRELLVKKIADAGDKLYQNSIAEGAERDQAEALRSICRRDAERIEQGLSFAGMDRWLNWICAEPAVILDYIHGLGMRLFIDEPLRLRNRLDAAQADLTERMRHMLEKAQTVAVSGEPIVRGTDVFITIDQWPCVVSFAQIASSGNGLPGGRNINLHGRACDSFRGREQHLIEIVRKRGLQEEIVVFTGSHSRSRRITEILAEGEAVGAVISSKSLPQGFVWPAAGLQLIGSQDIFGSERSVRKRRHAGVKIDLFSDLVPGELVVHEAHGIGRYEGLYNVDKKGVKRDYLQISYSGDDVLYIPMESLDQIQKYVGAEGREPKLSKLGGQDWNKLKEKAKQSIRKLATDLVKLYAERQAVRGHAFSPDTVWQQEFEEDFAYEETEDQLRCISEIKADMESDKVMDRLLCGDVGFGKTEVAFRAMFKCVMDGKQAIMLSPTTVLAQQHYENLKSRMAQFPVRIGLLSRFASEAMQKETIRGLRNGQIDIAVGTHRILSKDVVLKNPGLLVVDEEQRFGVDHKEKIKSLSPNIDVLTLTATPIPRTLHMSMAGIRDISVIEQAPLERRPVQTYVMEYDEDIISEACLRELAREGQVFYLFNDTRRIIDKAAQLQKLLPGAVVSYAHGKMGERRLEEIINSFINKEADILVCTTIIESGIDMPNVNTIIVEDADRLGLSQLYQLRGRVGRSDKQAFAYVTYKRDKILTEIAEKRLAAIRDFTELGAGFKIALRDLEVRGAGNLLGAEQHGHLDAIGYDLYCRMLDETIKELQGQPVQQARSAAVELDVDAYLPTSYIPDEGQRMDMYRRIGAIDSIQSWQDAIDEMLDRYGDVPVSAVTLADIACVRSIAERHGFARIYENKPNVVLAYDDQVQPDMGFVSAMMSLPMAKGMLLFNAGTKPHIVYRQAGSSRAGLTALLRRLLSEAEEELRKRGSDEGLRS